MSTSPPAAAWCTPTTLSLHHSFEPMAIAVDKRNFDAVLPTVLDAIQGADFIAVDAEMSGLFRRQNLKVSGACWGCGGV